jgi:hypothetical protein
MSSTPLQITNESIVNSIASTIEHEHQCYVDSIAGYRLASVGETSRVSALIVSAIVRDIEQVEEDLEERDFVLGVTNV